MADMKTRIYSLGDFAIDRKTKTLVADASTLRFALEQLFDDSCDVGIRVRSPYTDKVVAFGLSHADRHEGDLLAWILKPVCEADSPYTMTVYNT